MQLPKIRNGIFVSCDNDCIHMYGKSVLSMSMTYQKPKEGRVAQMGCLFQALSI